METAYLGYASRYLEEETYPFRCGWRFQLVDEDGLAPFLNHNFSLPSHKQSNSMKQAVSAFWEYGPQSPEFKKLRNPYLFELGYELLDLFFNGPDCHQIEEGFWYTLYLNDDEVKAGNCHLSSLDEADDFSIQWMICHDIEELGNTENQILHEVYLLEPSVFKDPLKAPLTAVTPTTVFSQIDFFYVGAALCVALVDNTGNRVGFFDIGFKGGSQVIPLQRRQMAMQSHQQILADFQASPAMTIILSHFHDDHCNLYRELNLIPNVAANSRWYVPQDASPLANAITALFQCTVYPNQWPANNALFHPPGFPGSLGIGKIDAVDGSPGQPTANRYCHHHGLYAMVNIRPSNFNVLLAGDCTYAGIPQNIKNDPLLGVLQACHHGGEYSKNPVPRNPADIPTPQPRYNLLCSANGITYGHPNPQRVAEHTARGWNNVIYLHTVADNGLNWFYYI